MKALLLALNLSGCSAMPGLYGEFGYGAHLIADCGRNDHDTRWCAPNPIGIVEAGHQWRNGVSVSLEHQSSTQARDVGINTLSVRYRFGGGDNYLDK